MFGAAGYTYVYLCYGIHHLFNIVTGPKEIPHAVLIRGIKPLKGINWMKARRKKKNEKELTNGPGKWTQAFGITTAHSGIDLLNNHVGIAITPRDPNFNSTDIIATPRIGIDYAEEWAQMPWRFLLQ